MTHTITTTSFEETELLGARLGQLLRGSELIELQGDLGAGKTTLVRGSIRGLGYEGAITSPTFTVMRHYDLPNGRHIAHVDLYRIAADDDVNQAIAEAVEDGSTVLIAEWATSGRVSLPVSRIVISLSSDAIDLNKRVVTFTVPKTLSYILEGLRA